MPTDIPPYKNVRNPVDSQELPHDELMWDVRAESDEDVPSEPSVQHPDTAARAEHAAPASDLLRRFPRPGKLKAQSEANRPSALRWVLVLGLSVASAAAAAWYVAGL